MQPCELVLTNVQIADVLLQRLYSGWIGISGGRFVYVEAGEPPDALHADTRLDVGGAVVAPGLIDAHMHIESSLITPRRFAEAVIPFGTTTILSDPHEVGNVAGEAGVRWMIGASLNVPLRIYHAIPSCVPATDPDLEWVNEVFNPTIIERLAGEPTVIALGEVMDYMGLLGANPRLQAIVEAAKGRGLMVEGHIPTLEGAALSQYLAHGVSSDHTLTFEAKITEQISKGVTVMLQTKSITPENVAVVNRLADRSRVVLITDDIEPSLLVYGHLSRMVTMAVAAGMEPLAALAAATTYPARYLGLRDLGAIAPGYRADFMVLDDLTAFPPQQVYIGGEKQAAGGQMIGTDLPNQPEQPSYPKAPTGFDETRFRVADAGDTRTVTANVVTLQTKKTTLTKLETLSLVLDDGYAQFSTGDNLALVGLFARNGAHQFVGVIQHTGLVRGAFASTVAHDCHNLIVIGRDVPSMVTAANTVAALGGGVAVADGEQVIAQLDLPYFGLLSDEPLATVAAGMTAIEDGLRGLGVDHSRPFLTLSIMGLSVSPYVKFTDRGIVDTETRELMPAYIAP